MSFLHIKLRRFPFCRVWIPKSEGGNPPLLSRDEPRNLGDLLVGLGDGGSVDTEVVEVEEYPNRPRPPLVRVWTGGVP